MVIIGGYWKNVEENKIAKILLEYKDLFPCNIMEL